MTADTFLAISYLMRNGGRLPNQLASVPRFSQPAFFEAPSVPTRGPGSFDEENIPLPEEEDLPPIHLPSLSKGTQPADSNQLESFPIPQDWTKPKIFRANDLPEDI